jgi:outer membrane protein assembly factor BamB
MQSQPSFLKHSFNDSRYLAGLVIALVAGVAAGCGGRNIHKELKSDPEVLVRQWTFSSHGPFNAGDRGLEYSNPTLYEHSLIFGNQSTGLVSIYPGLQATRWVLPIKNGVISEVSVEQGAAYFGGGDGFLYCVNAETGRVNWRYDLKNPLISRPTVQAGRVFVSTTDDTVYAFDAGTGKWLWHYKRRSTPTATTHGASAPLADGNDVLVGLSDGFLVDLGVNDGQLKWERKINQGTKFTDVDAHPVLDGSTLYVPSYDGALYAMKRQGGDTLWRFDAGASSSVVIDGDRLYLASTDGNVYALQKNNSKVLWKFGVDGGVPTHPVVTDRYVIFGSSHQYLYALDKVTGQGLYRWNAGYGSGFFGSPMYDAKRDQVYILSGAGNLYSFMVRKPPKRLFAHGQTDGYVF